MNATASTMTEAQHDALGQLLEAYDWHENDSIGGWYLDIVK
jgi:hypothetical protein